MLKEYLLENFTYDEPIFIREIKIDGMSENAVRQSFKRLLASGFLERQGRGIYYIPKPGQRILRNKLDSTDVVLRKYVGNETETFGYVTGLTFANEIGLTTQMSPVIEIVSNKESSNGRTVNICGLRVRIKKPVTTISEKNADILQLIDCVVQSKDYSELSEKETIKKILSYMRKRKFTKKELLEVTPNLTGSAAKKLIEWGLIYEFAS